MENENKKGLNVPPLRFPEFEGEWSNLKLSEICQRIIKKNSDLKINKVFTISSEYGLVDQETFFGRKVAGENLSNYLIVKRGDFAYNKSTSNNSPWGAVRKMEKDIGLVSNLYICFRPNINKVIPDFLLEYFQSSKWYKQISSISAEGARNHGLLNMSTKDFFNINHVFPLLAEQEKISRFLTTIDKRIALQRKTIEDLKKERLYYLYSFIEQAFKTYPLIRLDLITSESNEKSTVENQYRIISSTGKGIFFQDQYFNKQASSESNIGYKVLPYGYCTYRPMSDTGSFTFNIQKLCSMSIVSPAYPVFKFINYDSTVALAIMNNSDQFKKKMLKVKEGGTRFTLPFSKLKWLSVPKIPLNKQTKITYLLNIIDRRNEIYDMQLRYLLSIKEYLLKNLFI